MNTKQKKEKKAWKAYMQARNAALKAYIEATEPSRKAYKEALAPAWKAYEEAMQKGGVGEGGPRPPHASPSCDDCVHAHNAGPVDDDRCEGCYNARTGEDFTYFERRTVPAVDEGP